MLKGHWEDFGGFAALRLLPVFSSRADGLGPAMTRLRRNRSFNARRKSTTLDPACPQLQPGELADADDSA